MPKFTTKEHKSSGMYSSFNSRFYDIKLNKMICGSISEKSWSETYVKDEQYSISLTIKKEITKEHPAPFKWIHLKKRFPDVKTAKDFLNDNYDRIMKQFDLYFIND